MKKSIVPLPGSNCVESRRFAHRTGWTPASAFRGNGEPDFTTGKDPEGRGRFRGTDSGKSPILAQMDRKDQRNKGSVPAAALPGSSLARCGEGSFISRHG